tara:strand:- start:1897 stop:2244 length:348 start_codon:yes stop_codon:yes gene_type:complete
MANTTRRPKRGILSVLFDGATDWDLPTDMLEFSAWQQMGMAVKSIQVIGSATDDEITVRTVDPEGNADTSSPIMLKKIFADKYDDFVKYFDGSGRFPAVDATEVSANVEMVIEFE